MQVLAVITLHPASSPGASDAAIRKFPNLPSGGIAGRDNCGIVVFQGIPSALPYGAESVIGLRLRPGLDVATDYPTAWPLLSKARQIWNFPGGSFIAVAEADDADSTMALAQRLAVDPRIDQSSPWLTFRGQVFMPAANSF